MERSKIGKVGKVGSAVLLLTLIGCGGGGKQENDGGQDVRADVKADVKTDVKVDVPADVPVDLPTGVDVPGPTCTDRVLNGNETDVDCGGSCPGCPVGNDCGVAADCQSGVCTGGKCTGRQLHRRRQERQRDRRRLRRRLPGLRRGQGLPRRHRLRERRLLRAASARRRPAPTGSRTRRETDVDCGGSACSEVRRRQGVRQRRATARAAAATGGRCQSCTDAVKNGDETDVDCGGALCAGAPTARSAAPTPTA